LENLELKSGDKFLEVGAGSGIMEAYAYEIIGKKGKVIGIEINPKTYEFGKNNLKEAGYEHVKYILSDGSIGLEKEAPFNKILISAASPDIPKPLIEQLKIGGKIVAVVGSAQGNQELVSLEKGKKGKLIRKNLLQVVFVPLRGEYGWKD
jgi:protein-L-isoaspartate(D-aspartate) O-methyltransferase